MAVAYTEPVYFSELYGKDMEVTEVVDIILSTTNDSVRAKFLLELHQHFVDCYCPELKKTLKALNARFGHKRYEKPPTSPYMLQPGAELKNEIFCTRVVYRNEWVEIDMRLLQQWIRINFLPLCTKKYSWFALWRFLNDKGMLKDEKISSFCTQMNEWFFDPNAPDAKKPQEENVWSYNGYLSDNSYQQWDKEEFNKKKRNKNQTLEGFEHLRDICFNLAQRWVPTRLKPQIQTQS